MPTKRTLTRQLKDARDQIRGLVDERDQALGDAGSEHFNVTRLVKQIVEAREENDELRRQLAARPAGPAPDAWKTERSRLRQLLDLSERARASLDAQAVQLGQINDRMCRRAQDRAVVTEVTQ